MSDWSFGEEKEVEIEKKVEPFSTVLFQPSQSQILPKVAIKTTKIINEIKSLRCLYLGIKSIDDRTHAHLDFFGSER